MERGDALAQKLASAGNYEFTRSRFSRLRRAIDAPVRTTPSLAAVRKKFEAGRLTRRFTEVLFQGDTFVRKLQRFDIS